jgi:asparagine synthase (glutamine-hydrolysing)
MCGIAGIVDLAGRRPIAHGLIRAMANALYHRGPDQDGYLRRPGLALASCRLSIVDPEDGRQPVSNETGDVTVVFNGELFEYPDLRADLEKHGHHFATRCDTEVIPHLWEEFQEEMFSRLRGQFALAVWDKRRRLLILARDRFGVCPLHWTCRNNWLLFGSEIKALLASGLVTARTDLQGINHLFTFFALPGPVTCFKGVHSLLPGHYLRIQLDPSCDSPARVEDRVYWSMDFPDNGHEEIGRFPHLLNEFEGLLSRAVEKRLRADVPVVSYLSGGIDSGMVAALARQIRGEPLPSFTIQINDPRLDETVPATLVAEALGAKPIVVPCSETDVLRTYPELIDATESPVLDTSCAAMLRLARTVHKFGYKTALTGEGSDEWLAGYPWYKLDHLARAVDVFPGLHLSEIVLRSYLLLSRAPHFDWSHARRIQESVGGQNAWLRVYGLISLSKLRFFSRAMLEAVADRPPYEDLGLPTDRLRRMHPINRGLYLGARIMLPGLLLQAKGDRVAMNSSVETRYPFLDEDVFAFLARLHPRWKLRGMCDKYLLRLLAERFLPRSIARRPKVIFRAPFDSFYREKSPAFVKQLLSPQSLRKTGYFDPEAVSYWRREYRNLRRGSGRRLSIEMGLAGVVSTQLWHHTFIHAGLADLPSRVESARPILAAS